MGRAWLVDWGDLDRVGEACRLGSVRVRLGLSMWVGRTGLGLSWG